MNDFAMWIGYAVMVAGGLALALFLVAWALCGIGNFYCRVYDMGKVIDMVRFCERYKP